MASRRFGKISFLARSRTAWCAFVSAKFNWREAIPALAAPFRHAIPRPAPIFSDSRSASWSFAAPRFPLRRRATASIISTVWPRTPASPPRKLASFCASTTPSFSSSLNSILSLSSRPAGRGLPRPEAEGSAFQSWNLGLVSAAKLCEGQTNLGQAHADKPHLNRRLKTDQREFSNHPSCKNESCDERSHLGQCTAPKQDESRRQLAAAYDQAQNQTGKEVAVERSALQPHFGKRHNFFHHSDTANDGAEPDEEKED